LEKSKPSKDSVCPMCSKIPEIHTINDYPFVFSGMSNTYICEICHQELAIEFYEEESTFFEMASRFLGLDVLECKKRYLQDVVNTSSAMLSENPDKKGVEYLTGRIGKCKLQIEDIERFLKIKNSGVGDSEVEDSYRELQKRLSVPAFCIDFAFPDLIGIEFE
jgi:hypothetical protein